MIWFREVENGDSDAVLLMLNLYPCRLRLKQTASPIIITDHSNLFDSVLEAVGVVEKSGTYISGETWGRDLQKKAL